MPQKYKYEIHSHRKNDDLIVDRYEQFYDTDGNLVAESDPHTACIHPGDDVSDQPGRVRRAAKAEHVPTAVKKYKARRAYEKGQKAQLEAISAREEALAAYTAAVESGNKADITAARKARATTKSATTAATKASVTAKAAWDAARKAHEAFLDAEG